MWWGLPFRWCVKISSTGDDLLFVFNNFFEKFLPRTIWAIAMFIVSTNPVTNGGMESSKYWIMGGGFKKSKY